MVYGRVPRVAVTVTAVLLVLSVAGIAPLVSAQEGIYTGTIEGSSVRLTPEAESGTVEQLNQFARELGLEPKSHAFRLLRKDGTYEVLTDAEPTTAEARVSGTLIKGEDLGVSGTNVIIADDVTFDRDGTPVTLEAVAENPSRYDTRFVRLTTDHRQVAYTLDAGDDLHEPVVVSMSGGGSSFLGDRPPGQYARWSVVNLSADRVGEDRQVRVSSELGGAVPGTGVASGFWLDAETTVDAIVVAGSGGGFGLLIGSAEPTAREVSGPEAIVDRGSELEGQTVTFTAQTAGASISTKELLLSVAKCAPESVTVPTTPPGCVPVVTDTTVHAGVLASKDSASQGTVVPYTGLSNRRQSNVAIPVAGTYQVTGKVVSSDRLGLETVQAYGLLLYDTERRGELRVGTSGANRLDSAAGDVIAAVREQVTTAPGEYTHSTQGSDEREKGGDGTSGAESGNDGGTQDMDQGDQPPGGEVESSGSISQDDRAAEPSARKDFPLGVSDPDGRLRVIGLVAVVSGVVCRLGGEFWAGWRDADVAHLRLISYGMIVAGGAVAVGSVVTEPTIRLVHVLELAGGALWTLGAVYGFAWLLKVNLEGTAPRTPGRYPLALNLAGTAVFVATVYLGSVLGVFPILITLCFGFVAGVTVVLEEAWRRV